MGKCFASKTKRFKALMGCLSTAHGIAQETAVDAVHRNPVRSYAHVSAARATNKVDDPQLIPRPAISTNGQKEFIHKLRLLPGTGVGLMFKIKHN